MGQRILTILAIILVGVVCFFLGQHFNEDRIADLEVENFRLKDDLSFNHELLYNYEMAQYGWDTDSVIDSLWTTKYNELKAANELKRKLIETYEKYFDELSDSAQIELNRLYSTEL